jgi:septum formation protein
LLAELERPFEVMAPAIDETPWANEAPVSYVQRMAYEKAWAILATMNERDQVTVIAADTTVVLDGKMLGKPVDAADATATLKSLSGHQHVVMTGLCVWHCDEWGHTIKSDAVRTAVSFRQLSDEEIRRYVASGEPMDKAGSYAIQGGAAGMIDHIDGSYSNVVGLPMETLRINIQRSKSD